MNRKEEQFLRSVLATRIGAVRAKPSIPKLSYRGQNNQLPSLMSNVGNTNAKATKMYTGTKMLGVSQLHKSNAVPVFSQDEILDISKMRR